MQWFQGGARFSTDGSYTHFCFGELKINLLLFLSHHRFIFNVFHQVSNVCEKIWRFNHIQDSLG